MKLWIPITIALAAAGGVTAFVTLEQQRDQAILQSAQAAIDDAQRIIDASTPDTIPPLAAQPIDPQAMQIARQAGNTPTRFCRALGQSIRSNADPEHKRAMLARASEEFATHAKFAQQAGIKNRRIQLGMNTCMATAAWGEPQRINYTASPSGTHEQWVYGADYLHFQNGILTSYSGSR